MKNKIILFWLMVLILVNNVSFGQVSNCESAMTKESNASAIDVCLSELSSARSSEQDLLTAKNYLRLSKLYAMSGEMLKSGAYLDKLESHLAFDEHSELLYGWNRQRGLNYLHGFDYKQAELFLTEAYLIGGNSNNQIWLAKSSNDLGLINHKLKNIQQSLKYYKESLAHKEQIGNKYYIGTTLNNLGLINKEIGRTKQAIYYYEQALDNFLSYADNDNYDVRVLSNIAHLYEDLAVIYSEEKDESKNEFYMQKIIDTFSLKLSSTDRVRAFKNLALIHIEQKQLIQAKIFLQKAQQYQSENQVYVEDFLYIQAKISLLEKNYSTSESFSYKALELARANSNNELLSKLYHHLFLLNQKVGKSESAVENLASSYQYKELELANKYQADTQLIQEQIEKERFQRKAVEKSLLNQQQQNKINRLNNYILLAILLIFLSVFCIVIIVYKKRRERHQLLASIESHKEKLFLLETNTIDTESNEGDLKDDNQAFRLAIVDIMLQAINLWEQSTGLKVIDLAEKSKIWKVSIDSGRLRTRSLDRYLNLHKLPQNPRWKNVVKTCHYILSECELSQRDREGFEQKLQALMETIKMRSLQVYKA